MVVPCVAGMGEDLRHVCRKFDIRVTPNQWEETSLLENGRGWELLLKEAVHIQMTPSGKCSNQDGRLVAVIRGLRGAIHH